jgi:serine/threonine protein kinase
VLEPDYGNGRVGAVVANLSGSVHMSVPSAENESSQSSSGYSDGLGRRVLGFDRESGGILERLVLRPELTAFERVLSERIGILATIEDERFARPRAIERQDDRLTVVSEYLAGRRLSDIIECAADHGIVAGLDASLGLLLELLPALARLHDAGLAHGALAPGRVMITPAGQIVLLDAFYAEPLERLQLTR